MREADPVIGTGTDGPAADSDAPPASRRRRWPDRVISATPVFAAIALVLIVVGAIVLAIPVENPKVQDCGTPAAFVLTGRPDVFVDPTNPPKGLTEAQARSANENRCQERVAARAVPGGILLAIGLVIGVVAAIVEWVARVARRRDALVAYAPPGPDPSPGPLPPDR